MIINVLNVILINEEIGYESINRYDYKELGKHNND